MEKGQNCLELSEIEQKYPMFVFCSKMPLCVLIDTKLPLTLMECYQAQLVENNCHMVNPRKYLNCGKRPKLPKMEQKYTSFFFASKIPLSLFDGL